VAFVNALPLFIASDPRRAAKFAAAGVPIVGDDIKSQVGATITHRARQTVREPWGTAKTDLPAELRRQHEFPEHAGTIPAALEEDQQDPSYDLPDPLSFARRRRTYRTQRLRPLSYRPQHALVRLQGRGFGDVSVHLEYKLEVWDSPHSAGIIIDAVRPARSPGLVQARAED
jgi:myo-inositol-1-phosphate synthase